MREQAIVQMRIEDGARHRCDSRYAIVQRALRRGQEAACGVPWPTLPAILEQCATNAEQVVIVQRVDDRHTTTTSLIPDGRWQFDHGVRVQHVRLDVVEK